ncbi:olfactory receptor 56A4-like [Pleurodeles waltl]|uniref:olfactory receptor 56A4-like n=1 Tax=Pleurodeles waltl TaxID=8319 RepID=UPI0037099071
MDIFHDLVIEDLEKMVKIKNNKSENITIRERQALKALMENNNLEIKPADKGGNIVIMEKQQYMQEAYRQLNDKNHYLKLQRNPINDLIFELNRYLDSWHEAGLLNDDEKTFLRNENPTLPTIYFLPKIHKSLKNPPWRPIVSSCGALYENISTYVDFFLAPLVQNLSSYIKDTGDFLRILADIGWEEGYKLVTIDVGFEIMQNTERLLIKNISADQVTEFILIGFPGFGSWQLWLSIPLAFLLLLAVVANVTLVITIYIEQNLHEPMCYFLCYLSIADLPISMITTPKLLAILLFDSRSISLPGCFTQMFFVHMLLAAESGMLVAMAFDRYIAICSPLRYRSVLNNKLVVNLMAVTTGRAFLGAIPVPFLAARLYYCSDQIIRFPYCNNLAVTRLACDDISISSTYQMTVPNFILGGDVAMIFLSYCLILYAVLKLNTEGALKKAFATCSSHLIIILISYSSIIVIIIPRITDNKYAIYSVVLLNVLLLIVPPALNPVVYGVRNKEISQGIRKQFSRIDSKVSRSITTKHKIVTSLSFKVTINGKLFNFALSDTMEVSK